MSSPLGSVGRAAWRVVTFKAAIASAGVLVIFLAVTVIPFLAFAGKAASAANAVGISEEVPAEYRADVLRAGSLCPTITPALIAAQIHVESGWRKDAVSHAGAQGLAQFMPSTWAQYGTDGDGDGKADIANPHDSIISQGTYMCALLGMVTSYMESGRLHGDSVQLTLAAYNAGLGAVLNAGGIPENGETNTYVSNILSAMSRYQGTTLISSPTGEAKEALNWAIGIANDDSHHYVFGAAGPIHFDCSGLTLTYAKMRGVDLPRTADQQARTGRYIAEAEAQPGDLIFWSSNGGAHFYHTAIYLGDGQMVSADTEAQGINVEPIWGRNQYMIFTTHWH